MTHVEFAHCNACGWSRLVQNISREKGYVGACPECDSAKTSTDYIQTRRVDRSDTILSQKREERVNHIKQSNKP